MPYDQQKVSHGMNILITSVGRNVALIKEFKKALARFKGKVITVDINPLAAGLQFGDVSYIVPTYKDPSFVSALLSISKKHKVSLLVPTRDAELPIFAKEKKRFKKAGVTVMVADPKTIAICWDKLKFVRFCISHGFSTPRLYDISKKRISYRFPVFINDRFGLGSRSAYKIKNLDELNFFRRHIAHPILQEYIDWKEYTIDLFSDFEGNVISVVPRERILTFGGESFIGKTYKNSKLISESKKLAEALHLIGHNIIQCFFNGRDVKFIEVNPRYGGGSPLSFAAGAPTPAYLIRLARGEKVRSRIGKFKNAFVMLRYTKDIYKDAKHIVWKRIK